MTNPPPRPALRKATDSDIHPAVPRVGLHAVAAPAAATPPAGGTRGERPVALPARPTPGGKPGGTIPAWWPGTGAPEESKPRSNGAKKGRAGKTAKTGKTARTAGGGAKAAKRGGKEDKKSAKRARPVVVKVSLPADLHARLSTKAGEHRLSDAQALGELARVWLDG